MGFRREFIKMKPLILTDEDVRQEWGIHGNGLRCAFCGHTFVAGDVCRWQYMDKYPNIFVCQDCDDTAENLQSKMKLLLEKFRSNEFWFMRQYYGGQP